MTTVHVDSRAGDDQRRERLFRGDLYVLAPTPASVDLCTFARSMIQEAFDPFDPLDAQYHLSVEDWVARFAPVKPAFIHHPRTFDLLREVLADHDCDPALTHLDVPRLRGVTSHGYLTSGVGYAHHPHRDTWYSAPLCQLNWWLPIYEMASENAMAFHPNYWDRGLANGSAEFDYYEWNSTGRRDAAQHIRSDTRKQPKPEEELELEPEIRLVVPPGGIVLFAAAQLHSTVPNTSGRARFSIDFRTVHLADLRAGDGAPNVDSSPRGTSLRDFRRVGDAAPMPDELVARYDIGGGPDHGALVYTPIAATG